MTSFANRTYHWHATIQPDGTVRNEIAAGPVGRCCEHFNSWEEVREHERLRQLLRGA